jgi:subtilisin family serine protease
MKSSIYFVSGCIILFSLLNLDAKTQTFTDAEALQKIAEQETNADQKRKAEALNYAGKHSIPQSFQSPDGRFAELQYIDENGQAQYYITENANAAITISTNQLYSGGNAGLSLTGSGITAREWDAAAVRLTHDEFGNRVVQGDGITTLNYHSTHVAGTIMASGAVSAARGMAPAAQLRAFDWNNDAGEMATEGANGALMSNHSYGYIRGWYFNGSTWTWYGNPGISTQEDYLFGFYDSQAQSWDNIARNAPYFLVCKSAGNDRNDGPSGGAYPPDGPYDCISHAGIGKNILTVGAVNDIITGYTAPSSVVMSSFSSWGPADDGRIKPDIVANGVGLYSTDMDNNSDYTTLSGTSMATPSVTGSLALLQQHWNNLNPGTYMLSATLKALVIHTADEAGPSAGPDYQFGWGLMNTEHAALKISEDTNLNVIDELMLSNGGTYTRLVESDGTQPLKVTICWTDPAGTPVSAQLDPPTSMLVNELDLYLASSTTTFYPWKLDRDNPGNAATNNSENNIDNVEMVYLASPVAGTYTITVNHDGTLSGGSQAFSLIISGVSTSSPIDPPTCTSPVDPAPGATEVPVSTSLTWQVVTGAAGYLLFFGTNDPPTNIENGSNLGNVNVYTPATDLNFDQSYFWKVVPYNAGGQASGCPQWSFTTEGLPYIELPYSESFEFGFGQWAQSVNDDFDWARKTGPTPTPKTGPKKAYNGSYYIYTEASSPQAPGDEASIECTFNFNGIPNPELSFWYYMYGNQMGSLHVDIYNGAWTYDIWSLSGQQQGNDKLPWRNAIVNLSTYGNQTEVTIRIRGTIGSGDRSDICVDLVSAGQQGAYAPSDPERAAAKVRNFTEWYDQDSYEKTTAIEIYTFDHRVNIRDAGGKIICGQVSIFSTLGQILYLADINGTTSYTLNATLKPGIYIVRLATGNNVLSRIIPVY